MSGVNIKVMDNGPLVVEGEVTLLDAAGTAFETKSKTFLCRCGKSNNKPFCDGTHKGQFEDACRRQV